MIKEIKNKKLYNFPKNLSKKDYENTVSLIVDEFSRNDMVHSVFLMGDNWLPGISDIDIIVVYRGITDKNITLNKRKWPDDLKNIAIDIIEYDIQSFKKIRLIYPSYYKLNLIYGEDINLNDNLEKISEEELKILKASFAVDYIINKLFIYPYSLKGDINVSRQLLILHSFRFTQQLVEEISGIKINNDFSVKIDLMRKEWFSLSKEDQEKRIKKCIENSFDFISEIVTNLDSFLRNSFEKKEFREELSFRPPNLNILGTNKWDTNLFLNSLKHKRIKMPFSGKYLEKYNLIVPNSFFIIFRIYTKGTGSYSKWFKRFINKNTFKLNVESNGVLERGNAMNSLPKIKDGRLLTNLTLQYGFNNQPLFKEVIKNKIVNIFT